jgi:hypothetical protein
VKPALVSYDHYQFNRGGDAADYFLNLELIRRKSLRIGVPFLNIVQSSTWVPGELASPHSPRIPGPDELRFLVNTSLAYGAQGISYYIYSHPTHDGGMVDHQGNTTALYDEASVDNPAFVAIAKQLQPFESLGAFHAGSKVNGASMLDPNSPFQLEPAIPETQHQPGNRAQGVVLGLFGTKGAAPDKATHVMVVNLDYTLPKTLTLAGPRAFEIFDETSHQWTGAAGSKATLTLPKGGGKLVRLK